MSNSAACHCGRTVDPRDPDPWEGRMDAYCYDCATNRCDCYPDECPVKYPQASFHDEACTRCGATPETGQGEDCPECQGVVGTLRERQPYPTLEEREQAQRAAEREAIAKQFPCPECGAAPKEIKQEAVEEFRFAPRSADGEPMLFAGYDSPDGTTGGMRWETTVICENGHVIVKDDVRWFDEPRKGPPMLPSGGSRG